MQQAYLCAYKEMSYQQHLQILDTSLELSSDSLAPISYLSGVQQASPLHNCPLCITISDLEVSTYFRCWVRGSMQLLSTFEQDI